MADEHFWPAWDSDKGRLSGASEQSEHGSEAAGQPQDEATEAMHPVEATRAQSSVYPDDPMSPAEEASTDQFAAGLLDEGVYPAPTPEEPKGAGRKLRTGLGRAMMTAGAVLGVLVLVYAVDLFLSWGDVPRGVTVAGVDVGGMSRTAAEEELRDQLEPRFNEPVKVTAGDVVTELDPSESGLGIDWQATLEQAGQQPLSPVTRVSSFWTDREVGIVGKSDEPTLRKSVQKLVDDELNHAKREGDIKFKDVPGRPGAVEPVAVEPRQGQEVTDVDGAVNTINNSWLHEGGVELPVDIKPVKAKKAGVQATLDKLVKPAVQAPVEVKGDGTDATLQPKDIGAAFDFTARKDGSLKAEVDQETLKKALQPQLASTEQEGRDAQIVFEGGKPTVKPSKDGRKIVWKKTLEPYLEVIKKSEGRELEVEYTEKKPDVTTKEAKDLGIKEVIGEFTTRDFVKESGVNIRTVANQVDGAIVKPGATFSLNGHTGPRTKAQGYVEAGIIENGIPGKAVGGGISQFATTLYNASYFAGLKDAGHKEHSYYISRYPIAREATVFQAAGGGGIDLAFTNDAETGVAIQTNWTPDSITVKIWGTKRYDVKSKTGPKTNKKEAGERTVDSKDCKPSGGIDGFTATDTRTLYDADSGSKVRSETRKVTYNPKPEIKCKDDD